MLRVLGGIAEQSEYTLDGPTAVIGKSREALVRLHGWFKPKTAATIVRNGEGYALTVLGARTLVNSQPLNERHDLKDGDILEVGGLIMEFRLNAGSRDSHPGGDPALHAQT